MTTMLEVGRQIVAGARETFPVARLVGLALKDPKLVARLADVGGIPKPMTPAEFGKLVTDETAKWRKVVEFAGVSVD